MESLRTSLVCPFLRVDVLTAQEFADIETALKIIKSKPKGAQLLSDIEKATTSEKFTTIEVNKNLGSATIPLLTTSQRNKIKGYISPYYENEIATKFIKKGFFDTHGSGASSKIIWNSDYSIHIDDDGCSYFALDRIRSFTCLVHELIHSYRIMNGLVYNIGGNKNYISNREFKLEEYRVTGVHEFSDKNISENAIRAEHNLPIRKNYYFEGDRENF